MKATLLAFLVLGLSACGDIEVAGPSHPAAGTATSTGTATATETATATATGTATAASSAPSSAPEVVVNNTIDNTQNAAAPAVPSPSPVPAGQIAKGATEAEVEAVLGAPSLVAGCNSDATGWWWYPGSYCIGFEGGRVTSQYEVPASDLYLPSW